MCLAVSLQHREPLIPAFSPSEGEKGTIPKRRDQSPFSDLSPTGGKPLPRPIGWGEGWGEGVFLLKSHG